MTKKNVQFASEPQSLTTAEFYVLLSLSDQERHGYGIMKDVEASTAGEVHMGPGTLYGSIKRLVERGLVEESHERPDPDLDDQRRRYYRLTASGRQAAAHEAQRLARLVDTARGRKLLNPGDTVATVL